MRFRVNVAGDTYFCSEKEIEEGLFPQNAEISKTIKWVATSLVKMNREHLMGNGTRVDRLEGTFNGITIDVTLE